MCFPYVSPCLCMLSVCACGLLFIVSIRCLVGIPLVVVLVRLFLVCMCIRWWVLLCVFHGVVGSCVIFLRHIWFLVLLFSCVTRKALRLFKVFGYVLYRGIVIV